MTSIEVGGSEVGRLTLHLTSETRSINRRELGSGDTLGSGEAEHTEMEGDSLPFRLLLLLQFETFLLFWILQVVQDYCHKEIQQDLVEGNGGLGLYTQHILPTPENLSHITHTHTTLRFLSF